MRKSPGGEGSGYQRFRRSSVRFRQTVHLGVVRQHFLSRMKPRVADDKNRTMRHRPSAPSRFGKPRRRPHLRRALLERLEDRRVLATILWDGSTDGDGDGINWHDPANWEGNVRPGPGDDVIVGAEFADSTIKVSSIVSDTVNSIDSDAEFLFDSGRITVANDSRVARLTMAQSYGFAEVPGSRARLDIDGDFDWTGQSGLGFTEAHVYGHLHITGIGERTIGTNFHSHGTAVWDGAIIRGFRFYNHGTMTTHTNSWYEPFGGAEFFNMPGATLIHDADVDGENYMSVGALVNDGTVEVRRGKLASDSFTQGRTSHGVYNVAADAEFQFGHAETLGTDSVVNAEGTITFAGGTDVHGTINASGVVNQTNGTLRLHHDVTFPVFNMLGGAVEASVHTITIPNEFNFDYGGINSATILSQGDLHLGRTGRDGPLVQGTTLINEGNAIWHDAVLSMGYTSSIINRGTFEVRHDKTLIGFVTVNHVYNEAGALWVKSAGTGTQVMGSVPFRPLTFHNAGTLRIESGGIDFDIYEQPGGTTEIVDGARIGVNAVDGGYFTASGNVIKDLEHSAGEISPAGNAAGTLTFDGDYTASSGAELRIQVGGLIAGTESDQVIVNGNATVDGKLIIETQPGYSPTIGDQYELLSAISLNGSFDQLDGRLLSFDSAWEVSYTETGAVLTVVAITEAELAEIVRQELNSGILQTRASLAGWFDAGDFGLPGSSRGLGASMQEFLTSVAPTLLPTTGQPVTSFDELRSRLASAGYQVDCVFGESGCTSKFIGLSIPNRSTSGQQTLQTDPGTLTAASLSRLPDEVELSGSLNLNGTASLGDFSIGFDIDGYFVDQSSSLSLSVTGGGQVSERDVALQAGGLSLDFDGTISIADTKPVAAMLTTQTQLRSGDFGLPGDSIFDVDSSAETRLTIDHTIQPIGLSYDGTWVVYVDCSGESCSLEEVSVDVDYPSTDDWTASLVAVLGSAVDVLLGPEAAGNFNELTLPLVANSIPADAAPQLFGINPVEFEGPETTWIEDVFGGARSALNFVYGDGEPESGTGLFETEGDVLIKANRLRHDRDVDGTGTKIGVISSGALGLDYAKATFDVPADLPIFIPSGVQPSGGRGTAMLEILHDVAPGAELRFAAATDTRSFIDAVTWLLDVQEVDVIVSDVIDYSAPMFSLGPLAAFLENRLAAHDAVFVQAAGNDGERSIRDRLDFVSFVDQPGSPARLLHRFGGTSQQPQFTLPVTLAPQSVSRFVLQTGQPANAPTARIVGRVASLPQDVELNRIGFPLDSNTGRDSEIPTTVDSFTLANHTAQSVTVDLMIELIAGQIPANVPVDYQLVALGDITMDVAGEGGLLGTALLEDVLVVGANEVDVPDQAASYSNAGSAGGRQVDVVAPAGVEFSGFGNEVLSGLYYGKFHGTSSSAAHVAGAAALLKNVKPDATSAEIRQAFKQTATPLGSGSNDPRSGRGQIDAMAAAQSLVPQTPKPDDPPTEDEPGFFDFLSDWPIISSVELPTQQQLDTLLQGGEVLVGDIMQLWVNLNEDSSGSFAAEFPFDLGGVGGFDQFDVSGRVAIEAKPDITFQFGWDDEGWFLNVPTSSVAADLTGIGEARGVAIDTFGVGVGATVTARPSLDLAAIDRGGDGRIRQDDIDSLAVDLSGGDVSLVLPKLDSLGADLHGDVILGFLDYVDIDRDLPNRPNGGDPFIVRGRTDLTVDFGGDQPQWTFGEFVLANPDIDGDGQPDYTIGALARNAAMFGEDVINAIEVPEFVNDLLGGFGLGGGPRRDTPLERPRGMLPEQLPDAPEAAASKDRINAHLGNALAAANHDPAAVDLESLQGAIRIELQQWLEGPPPPPGPLPEGESHPEPSSILERLEMLRRDIARPIVDLPDTPEDEFEISMNLALSSYFQWREALEQVDLKPEDVVDQATLDTLNQRLVNGLRHAIERSHAGAIELFLAGAPLDHQYDSAGSLTQRGVMDRALEAVRWAQTAELVGVATADNGLGVAKALDDLVVRVVVDRAELVFPDDAVNDGYIGPDDEVHFLAETGWQIRVPPSGGDVDIDAVDSYDFGSVMRDSGGNIEVLSAGASNNNSIAGEAVRFDLDPVTGVPRRNEVDLLPMTRGITDSNGSYRTTVRLGQGDTHAQIQFDIGLKGIPVHNATTNTIAGRPTIELLAAHISEDDSALRKDNLFVESGGELAIQARIRHGNGPLSDASLNFFVDGGGSLDQITATTIRNIPRTDSDGIATVVYTASETNPRPATIGVSYFEKGRLFRDRITVIPRDLEFSGYRLSPMVKPGNSTEQVAVDARDAFADALADGDVIELEEDILGDLNGLLTGWLDSIRQAASDVRSLAQDPSSGLGDAAQAVEHTLSDYFEWLSHATLLERDITADQTVCETDLYMAMQSIIGRFLGQFDGSAASGGLRPLYRALSWARTLETLVAVRPSLASETTLDAEEVLEQSRVAVELLPPTTTSTSVSPILTGDTDDATLHVSARIVRRLPGGEVVPVMQTDSLPAPTEIRIVPFGLATARLNLPPDQTPAFVSDSDIQLRKGLIGSQFRFNPASIDDPLVDPYSLVAADQVMTGTATRGAGENELAINIAVGIPGLILETFVAELRDPPQLNLQVAKSGQDDSALRDSVNLAVGERAIVRASLRRNGVPIGEEVKLVLIGDGELSANSGDTGTLGVLGGIEFTPPPVPSDPASQATHGISLVVVQVVQDGVIYTDSVEIRYAYVGVGEIGDLIGTPDYIRASQALAFALDDAADVDPATGIPDIDHDQLQLQAVEILRDWFSEDTSDPAGEGSVTYWLKQVQDPADGGAYPIDTAWNESGLPQDAAYRTALEAAIDNWLRWKAVTAQMGLEELDVISSPARQQVHSLVGTAIRHAIDRVHARCQARLPEYLSHPSSTAEELSGKEERLARLIIEGDQAVDYYQQLRLLSEFAEIVPDVEVDFLNVLSQLCYRVEIVEDETFLDGSGQRAQVHVKAGIRVEGVDELLLPPESAPLVVNIEPVGNATLSGLGLGRTDANGVYDRVAVSAGGGDLELAVDVSVVFRFDNTNDPKAKRTAKAFSYAKRQISIDTLERSTAIWGRARDGAAKLDDRPVTLVDGETALAEIRVTKGRAPVIGRPVNLVLLGGGSILTQNRVTDAQGRIRFSFAPPSGSVGRTQIAYAYQLNGETVSDTITFDYTTSESGANGFDVAYSEAQAIATTEAGLHVAQVDFDTVLGGEPEIDFDLLRSIQLTWLETGLDSAGNVDPSQRCGVRCFTVKADQAPIELKYEQVLRAAFEFQQWRNATNVFDLEDSIAAETETARQQLETIIQSTINQLVIKAIDERSAEYARQAMGLAITARQANLLSESEQYTLNSIRETLGYEIRVDEARLHGDADNAWVQIVTRVYLTDGADPDGPKVRAARDTPIDLDVTALGFRIDNVETTVTNGLYSAKAYLIEGDTDLELAIQARDEFAFSELLVVRQPGGFALDAGARLESDDTAALVGSMTLYAGQQARIEGIVQKGFGRVGFRQVLYAIEGAPNDSMIRVPDETDKFVFTPPSGQTGEATIRLFFNTGQEILESSVTVAFSNQVAPSGEFIEGPTDSGNGLLNNQHTIDAFNEQAVPLSAGGEGSQLGSALSLSAFEFPLDGGLPTASEFRRDVGNWFSNSLDLLHIDLEALLGILNGAPATPQEIVRLKLDLDNAPLPVSPTLLAADFSDLLPDGFEGSISLDRPELGGQIVFGIDTSRSPFYVLTQPDRLLTRQPSLEDFYSGGAEELVEAGREATTMTTRFGVSATLNSNQQLIDGILSVPHAEGYLSTVLGVDFSEVAAETGKLRFDNLTELANLQVGFVGNPIDSFQAIASAEVTLPNLAGINDNDHPLADVGVIAAITGEGGLFQFQLRTGEFFEPNPEVIDRLTTRTVDRPLTGDVETDDKYEPNDSWQSIRSDSAANLGVLTDQLTIGGQDPQSSDDLLALNDRADWFRFETIEVGNASSFVRIDFDRSRGDLDLTLYRLDGTNLVPIRTDGLPSTNQAQVTLLGQPPGVYFAKVFDDRGGLNPFYALTIDPPGRVDPGIDVTIGDFQVRDTALEINVDTNLEFEGTLSGRMVMTFGRQNDIPVELEFRAAIDTNIDDDQDNGGIVGQLSTHLGGRAINVLHLHDDSGQPIPPPSHGAFSTTVDAATGGYVLFDYVSTTDFKFAGFDAAAKRWVMGSYNGDGWSVPSDTGWRSVASPTNASVRRFDLVFDGRNVELWVRDAAAAPQRVISQTFNENIDGNLGLGTPAGEAKFGEAILRAGTMIPASESDSGAPEFPITLFLDSFAGVARKEWEVQTAVWRIDEQGNYTARSTSIELGDWLLVDSAQIIGTVDIQFNDNDLLIPPALNPTSEDQGKISVGIDLDNVNALLFRVGNDEDGTKLYPELDDSPKGLVAIREGSLTIRPDGVRLGAGSVSAGLQDVLFVDITGAEINLTPDPNEPLLASSDIKIRVPALSDDGDFVTISGATPGERLFGLSKPTPTDLIPEFLLFQDTVTIDFAVDDLQKQIDVEGVFPFSLGKVGLRFNDAGGVDGQIGNLADFDLLVQASIDFDNPLFSNLPFTPIFAVGQPDREATPGQRRVSSASAYADNCDTTLISNRFAGFDGLCQNGFLSAELHLGALLGDQPELLLRNLGPFYVGIADVELSEQLDLAFNGLIELGGFENGEFRPFVKGSLAATKISDGTGVGSITLAGNFEGPILIDDQGTPETEDDEYESSLNLDWYGELDGEIGVFFVNASGAAVSLNTKFINRFSVEDPLNPSIEVTIGDIQTGNVCVEFGEHVEICGSAILNFDAGDDEPFIVVDEGSIEFGEELGPLAQRQFAAGGIGIGRDGTIYVLPAGYQVGDVTLEKGAHVEVTSDQPGGLFGLPEWVPLVVSGIGLEFNGIANPNNPNQPLTINESVFTSPSNVAIPLTDPENFSFVISGGFVGNKMFPVVGEVERLRVDLGSLAGCVAIALENVGPEVLDLFPGHIFDSACEFPITGIEGITVGIEPINVGPIKVGGVLGLGMYSFERPVDQFDPTGPTETQNVFWGRVEGEITYAKIGVGVELIITQYGPILGRITAGAPIPISTLAGLIGGPIGAAIGNGAGFLITGLQGGIVWDNDPLPVIDDPTEIFTTPGFRSPLELTSSEIRNAVEELAYQNPTFSQLIQQATDPDNIPVFGQNQSLAETFVDILSGRIPGIDVRFTWEEGFKLVVSGTLTNQYVSAQVGLGVTLGVNVGYDFDVLTPKHANGAPAKDTEGYALDSEGNHLDQDGNVVEEGLGTAFATFDDLFGFQIYGFADIEVFGFKIVGAGILLDFTDVLNPAYVIAAALPSEPSLISLLMPVQGVIGARIDFDGYAESGILAPLAFFDSLLENTDDFFYEVLTAIKAGPPLGLASPLSGFSDQREADRRHDAGINLRDVTHAEYDPRFDPDFTGYDPADPNPTPDLWLQLLDVDGNGEVEPAEDREITREFVIDRLLGNEGPPAIPSILPSLENFDLGDANPFELSYMVNILVQEMLIAAPTLLLDEQAALALTQGIPFWDSLETQLERVHQATLLTVDDPSQRDALETAYQVQLNSTRVIAAFTYRVGLLVYEGADAVVSKYAELFNPSFQIKGQLSPMFFGIPMGPPNTEVELIISKEELTLRGAHAVLGTMLNFYALPAFITDRTELDVHFPFTNLLDDFFHARPPTIDPLAEDWRVNLNSSFSILGMEVGNVEGLIFPADANELLVDGEDAKLQIYEPQTTTTLEADKILVRQEDLPKLLQHGGMLFDGRMTLPRFITDPLALWADLEDEYGLSDLWTEVTDGCEGIWECVTTNPMETFNLLSTLPDVIGDATAIEEVAQVQFFMPNMIDDFLESLDEGAREELERLTDPETAVSGDGLAAFIQREFTEAFDASFTALQDAYLIGSYGRLPDPFGDQPFPSIIPHPDDPQADPPFPTTPKILGINLGGGEVKGEISDSGFEIEIGGTFLGLGDVRFLTSLDHSNSDPRLRLGGEFVIGASPAACEITPTTFQGTEDADEVGQQLLAFLANVGLTDDPDALSGDIESAAGAAFEWLNLDQVGGGACLRAFSPGFDPSAPEGSLLRSGGIEAHATIGIADFINGEFTFQISPSANHPIPNVTMRGSANEVLLPGLDGFEPQFGDDALFGRSLDVEFVHQDGALSGFLSGTITMLGQQFTLSTPNAGSSQGLSQASAASDPSLVIDSGGISGDILLTTNGLAETVLETPFYKIAGRFKLNFDTATSSASISVEDGSLVLKSLGQGPDLLSLSDVNLSITVGASGVHVSEISGTSNLLGANTIEFNGGFDITRDLLLDNVDLTANADLAITVDIGPGSLQGAATVAVDLASPGIHGTFTGSGTILGVVYASVSGTYDSRGCVSIESPFPVHFQLPGSGADCDAAHDASFAFSLGDPDKSVVVEGVDSSIQLDVIATIFGEFDPDVDPVRISLPLIVTSDDATGFDYSLPTAEFEFPTDFTEAGEGKMKASFTINIVDDSNPENTEHFLVRIDKDNVVTPGDESFYVSPSAKEFTIEDNDEPDFSDLAPPGDTLVYFNFDQERMANGRRLRPAFSDQSVDDLNSPFAGYFEVSTISRGVASDYSPGYQYDSPGSGVVKPSLLLSADGLPVAIDTPRGSIELVPSRAIGDNGILSNSYFEFTIDPKQGGWLPQGIQFFASELNGDGTFDDWKLSWSLDNYAEPIFSGTDAIANQVTGVDLIPGWTRHTARLGPQNPLPSFSGVPVQNRFCWESPITFRLSRSNPVADPWHVDNLAVFGRHFASGCATLAGDSIVLIQEFLQRDDLLLPGDLLHTGAGNLTLGLGNDSGNIDPIDRSSLVVTVSNASAASTVFELVDNGQNVPPSQQVPIHIRIDGGVRSADLTGGDTFVGSFVVDGAVAEAITFDRIADGSTIMIDNAGGRAVNLSATSLGNNVQIMATGDIGSLNIGGAWLGGSLQANSAAGVTIAGDMFANVQLQRGLGSFDVHGGDLLSPIFETGLAGGTADGSVGEINVTRVNGVGGSILAGSLLIDGDVDSILADGGSINTTIQAGFVGNIAATIDLPNDSGGNVAGEYHLGSVGILSSTGGDMTATVTTSDSQYHDTRVASYPVGGRGGSVNSPNSFHFAGGIDSIIANQIDLRVEAGGNINKIIAVDDGSDRPASLTGRFTAHRFGRIETDRNGTANFEVTATAGAWELNGAPAFDAIVVQSGAGEWLEDQIHLNRNVNSGSIEFLGDTDGDGVLDIVEDAAPGGGDGNSDGIADSSQPHVASFESVDNGAYVTLVAGTGRLAAVTSHSSAEFPVDLLNHNFASGLVDFSVTDIPVGGTVRVDLIFHSGEDVTGLFYLQPSAQPSLVELSNTDGSPTEIQILSAGNVSAIFREDGIADRDDSPDGDIALTIGAALSDGVVTNPINRFDVNNDSRVSPLDALSVINLLARLQTTAAGVSLSSSRLFADVNRDGQASPLDALTVINLLARQSVTVEGERVSAEQIRRRRSDLIFASSLRDPRSDDYESLIDQSIRELF